MMYDLVCIIVQFFAFKKSAIERHNDCILLEMDQQDRYLAQWLTLLGSPTPHK